MPNGDHLFLQHAHASLNHARKGKGDNTAVIAEFNRLVNQHSPTPESRASTLRYLKTSEEGLQDLLREGYLAEADNLLDKARKTHHTTDLELAEMRQYLKKADANYADIDTSVEEVLTLLRKGYRNGARDAIHELLMQWALRPDRITQAHLDELDFYLPLTRLNMAELGLDEPTLRLIRHKVAQNAA